MMIMMIIMVMMIDDYDVNSRSASALSDAGPLLLLLLSLEGLGFTRMGLLSTSANEKNSLRSFSSYSSDLTQYVVFTH